MAERIDGEELLNQRADFDQDRFQSSSVKREMPCPFQRT
jgi:hypothetical protein